jgi:hypothetical protein
MITWTLDEFKKLEKSLYNQENGFTVVKEIKFYYILHKGNIIAKYDLNTGAIKSL